MKVCFYGVWKTKWTPLKVLIVKVPPYNSRIIYKTSGRHINQKHARRRHCQRRFSNFFLSFGRTSSKD